MSSSPLGFVIGRHIASPSHAGLCFRAYKSVRRFYPDSPIIIVDDNSALPDQNTYDDRTTIIQSTTHGAGEFGLYYYYHSTHLFDRGVLMHDSMVINKPLNLPNGPIAYLWHFPPNAALEVVVKDVNKLLSKLKNKDEAKRKYKSRAWLGMFGCGSVLTWDYLNRIARHYRLFNLLSKVDTRLKRCAMERVLGILCSEALDQGKPSLNGNIFDFPGFSTARSELLIGYGGTMDKTWHGR